MFKMFTGQGNKQGGAPGAKGPAGAQVLTPQFTKGHPLDAHLFISEQPDWRVAAAGQPVWTTADVPLAEAGVLRRGVHVYRPSPVRCVGGWRWRWVAGAGAGRDCKTLPGCLLRVEQTPPGCSI